MREYLSILRIHIVLIAVFGLLVFGWLLTGRYFVGVALIAGLDWLLINLANRVSDIAEDLANRIPGAERVASSKVAYLVAFVVLLAGSFVLSILIYPEITWWRILMQFTGFVYNFKVIPAQKGWIRLKNLYFFKNFLSAFGFFITCFGYPLAMCGYAPALGWSAVPALVLYFVPYELSFEIFYDFRDVEGDRKEGVRTYPVVHGQETSVKIIDGLLIGSVLISFAAFFIGAIGAREALMAGGPAIQYLVLHPLIRRGVTTSHCVWVTHMGTGLLAFYLAGTAVWVKLGLMKNFFLWAG